MFSNLYILPRCWLTNDTSENVVWLATSLGCCIILKTSTKRNRIGITFTTWWNNRCTWLIINFLILFKERLNAKFIFKLEQLSKPIIGCKSPGLLKNSYLSLMVLDVSGLCMGYAEQFIRRLIFRENYMVNGYLKTLSSIMR